VRLYGQLKTRWSIFSLQRHDRSFNRLIPGIQQEPKRFIAAGLIGAKSIWLRMASQCSRFLGNKNLKHLFLWVEG
jgi:hypothetical protein